MSIKHKYVEPVLIFLAVYLFHYVICQCGELLFIYSYTYLSEVVPSIVKTVNPISTPNEYEIYLKCIATSGAFVGLFITNYVCLRLDNAKFEHVITKTDGQYTMKDGLRLYFSEFFISDVIASSIIIGPFVCGACFIPEKLLDKGLIFVFRIGVSLIEFYGIVGSVLIAILFSLITRLISVPLVLRAWRALWLSGAV